MKKTVLLLWYLFQRIVEEIKKNKNDNSKQTHNLTKKENYFKLKPFYLLIYGKQLKNKTCCGSFDDFLSFPGKNIDQIYYKAESPSFIRYQKDLKEVKKMQTKRVLSRNEKQTSKNQTKTKQPLPFSGASFRHVFAPSCPNCQKISKSKLQTLIRQSKQNKQMKVSDNKTERPHAPPTEIYTHYSLHSRELTETPRGKRKKRHKRCWKFGLQNKTGLTHTLILMSSKTSPPSPQKLPPYLNNSIYTLTHRHTYIHGPLGLFVSNPSRLIQHVIRKEKKK